jgi:hypothetical protein
VDRLIQEILVIHDCGVVLSSWRYTQIHPLGRDLIGGLISAIGVVGRETFHDDLKEIIFTNYKIVFKRVAWYCVVAIVEHKDDTNEIGKLLTEISRHFESQHGHALSQLGTSRRSVYASFLETLEDLISPFMDLAIQTREISNRNSLDLMDSSDDHIFVYEKKSSEPRTSTLKKDPSTDLSSE